MKKTAPSKTRKRPTTGRVAGSKVRFKVMVEEKEIRKRVRELARQINRDYAGKSLLVVGILEGCFVFMADLVRAITVPVACSFVRSQVRDSESGLVAMREILYIPPVDAAGKDVLLVDGVLQSGITLDHLSRTLLAQQPASLRIAALIDKVEDRKVDVPVDYAGFKLSGRYLVGYGLGYDGQLRNLPYLARITESGETVKP
jgi:hypoxanthine phosphoribosyltransferase